jgi:hypothetical protein
VRIIAPVGDSLGSGFVCRNEQPPASIARIDRSALTAQRSADDGPRAGSVSTWARLIQRVYEVDPLACPSCGGTMKIISFIERRQQDVIERILRHGGLWEGPLRTLAHPRAPPLPAEPDEDQPRELQLVLDPELL